jgi:hypothetical protein
MGDVGKKETMLVFCDECDSKVSATVEGEYQDFADEPGFAVRFRLLKCPECKTPILVLQDDDDARTTDEDVGRWGKPTRLYPDSEKRQLGSAVPEPIRKAFTEAFACFDNAKAYTACAIMCRKVLEGVCESHGAKGTNLAARLENLFERGELDKRLYEWITALRQVGNEAAHDVGTTVSREVASDLLDFSEAVAEHLYTFKVKFEAFQNRRKKAEEDGAAKKAQRGK